MPPLELSIAEQKELVALLDEIFTKPSPNDPPEVTIEEAKSRLRRACRLAYGVTRDAISSDRPLMSSLHETAVERRTDNDLNSITAALMLEAISRFLDLKWKQNKELFKTEFIMGLDHAVQQASHCIEERYDTSSEQSASQRTAQPPATS